MCIGLTYDLRTDYLAQGYSEQQVAEFDSESTIDALEAALQHAGHRVERIGFAKNLIRLLAAGQRWDLVFNICEGLHGRSREAQVPALLELYNIPYTFGDPLCCALTLDKAMAKRIIRDAGLLTPAFVLVTQLSDLDGLKLDYPVFAKPVAEGTGKGVDHRSRIETATQLRAVCQDLLAHFTQPVLVEKYLPGREFTTALLGTGTQAEVLGTMEITIRADARTTDYSYKIKEQCETYVHYYEMERGPLREAVEALSLASYRALEGRDTGRVDVRLDAHEQPCFIELNPLPGLHPSHSDLPMIATQQGMPYKDLITRIINSALQRREVPSCQIT
ncbi:MAG: D-alanine--D-alanine ligase [Phycisphaeraceae bacterium]|nr:D-alanine--D-alanine ligase [Phycisphaeraceae bacterium]